MKKIIFVGSILLAAVCAIRAANNVTETYEQTVTDVYLLKMTIKNPRVVDNMSSLGYRKYTRDILLGELRITYPLNSTERAKISVTGLYNKSYKIGKDYVTYVAEVDEEKVFPRVNMIGNNKTNVFKTPSVMFALMLDPVYNVGDVEEDNTLNIVLSGTGTVTKTKRKGSQIIKSLSGSLSGTIGCGCYAYGHVSPTRVNGAYGPICEYVDDVAAAWGQWHATYKYSTVD